MLGETSFKGSDIVVGWGDALAEDGKEDEDRGAYKTKKQSTKRNGVHAPTPPSFRVQRPRARGLRVGGDSAVL